MQGIGNRIITDIAMWHLIKKNRLQPCNNITPVKPCQPVGYNFIIEQRQLRIGSRQYLIDQGQWNQQLVFRLVKVQWTCKKFKLRLDIPGW